MDVSYVTGNDKFNYRACAVIICDNKILAMKDEHSPYFYLPGGRVKLGETAENAVLRELREELGVDASIIRPLWLNQAFYTEDVDRLNYHELGMCFLIDVSGTDVLSRGSVFVTREDNQTNTFEWLDFERLKDEYFYPLFIKEKIFDLPQHFTVIVENR